MDQNTDYDVLKAAELRKSMDGKSIDQQIRIVDELKILYENNPTDMVILDYAQSLAYLSMSQRKKKDMNEEKETIETLKALYEKYENEVIAREYAVALRGLAWDRLGKNDFNGAKETIETLETLYAKYDNEDITRYYDETLRALLLFQGHKGDIDKAKETIEMFKSLFYKDKNIPSAYAWALKSLSQAQGDNGVINGAKETIEKLKVLYEKYDDEDIASAYADALRSLSRNQSNNGYINGAKETIEKLKALYEKEKIFASAYADALNKLSDKQGRDGDINKAKETIENLKTLYEKNEIIDIASAYAEALRSLSWNQSGNGDISGAKETIEKLKVLYDKYKNIFIAIDFAWALVILSWYQGNNEDINGAKETVEKLKALHDKDEDTIIASHYASALESLSQVQGYYGDINGAEETIEKLKALYDKNEDFANYYASALAGLSQYQANRVNKEKTEETIEKLKILYDKHKKENIASYYVWGLAGLSQNQVNCGNIEKAEETIEKIKFLYEKNIENDLFRYITTNQISDLLAETISVNSATISGNQINLLDKTINTFKPKLDQEASFTFNKIIDKYELGGKKDLYARIIQIYICIAKINSMLIVKNTRGDKPIGHYTKIKRLNNLLIKNEYKDKEHKKGNTTKNKNNIGRLRLSNASYMNDPSEGRALLEYLKKISNKSEPTNHRDNVIDKLADRYTEEFGASNVYLFSLTEAIDILPMWSMYGEDGQGCCLVFDSNIFDTPKDNLLGSTIREETRINLPQPHQAERIIPSTATYEESDNFLLHKIYYLPVSNSGESSEEMAKLLGKLAWAIDQTPLEKLNDEDEKNKVLDLIADSLDEIRYLFKTDDYSFEQEYRLLRLVDITNEKVKLSEIENSVPRLYIEFENKVNYKEIILGPKISDPDFIAPYITYVDRIIKVRKSSIEYR